MAIQINATITTDEGFQVVNPWAWVDQYLISSNWANLQYYKSKSDFQAGYQPLNVQNLPSNVSTELTNAEFWGNNLAEVFTQKCVNAIEDVLGPGTCTIDKSDPFA